MASLFALSLLPGHKDLVVVPGASHLFEEPGALEQVAALARDWFEVQLRSGKGGAMFSDEGIVDGLDGH